MQLIIIFFALLIYILKENDLILHCTLSIKHSIFFGFICYVGCERNPSKINMKIK